MIPILAFLVTRVFKITLSLRLHEASRSSNPVESNDSFASSDVPPSPEGKVFSSRKIPESILNKTSLPVYCARIFAFLRYKPFESDKTSSVIYEAEKAFTLPSRSSVNSSRETFVPPRSPGRAAGSTRLPVKETKPSSSQEVATYAPASQSRTPPKEKAIP